MQSFPYVFGRFVTAISIGIVLVALALRTIVYISNPTLYADETLLANNVLSLTYKELCGSLGWGQAAPLGFLMLAKTCVKLFGENELALRLWPFVASCLGVYLFYSLSKEYLRGGEVIGALLLFSFSKSHIFYAVDFKQYSTDALAAISVLLLALYFRKYKIRWSFFALGGALLIWLSHPVTFVLAGLVCSDFAAQLMKKNKTEIKRVILTGLFWFGSFAINYVVSLYRVSHQNNIATFWGPHYFQGPLFSGDLIKVLGEKIVDIFVYNFGFDPPAFVPLGLFCAGCLKVCFENRREGWYLISPIIIAIAGFLLKQYPLFQRLTLFLVPILVILLVKGIAAIQAGNKYVTRLIQIILLILLLYAPLTTIACRPIKKTMYIPALTYIQNNYKPGDVVLGLDTIDYYFSRMGFKGAAFAHVPPGELPKMLKEIALNVDVWIITRFNGLDIVESTVRAGGRTAKAHPFDDFMVYQCEPESTKK